MEFGKQRRAMKSYISSHQIIIMLTTYESKKRKNQRRKQYKIVFLYMEYLFCVLLGIQPRTV